MMVSALIFAGGTGQRMNTRAKPKQFLELHGKPVLLYTIEHFEKHPAVDNITVVCLKSYIQELKMFLRRYEISKVNNIVEGGESGDESIYNGLQSLENICAADDIVLIHDGVRPLIDEYLISDNIDCVHKYGNAVTVEAVTESVVRLRKDGTVLDSPPRAEMYFAKAPQSFFYKNIWDLYKRARIDGIRTIDSSFLCYNYNVEVHTVISSPNNIKITAPQDYYIFRALYEMHENKQFLGV